MLKRLMRSVFGSRNDRVISRYRQLLSQATQYEEKYRTLADSDFPDLTASFRDRYNNGESLDSLLLEAFLLCSEASSRTLNMRHFDVQLMGGIALHQGKIAEMRTGEGKTLVATLAAYLNALSGRGVHVVTVNDYLASRDASWMGKLYLFLGLTVGVNCSGLTTEEKKEVYKKDIVYGTNNEFGFDYLRDNMVYSMDSKVQRELNYAIVDEVDSILIDEARTPLIISGQSDDCSDLYVSMVAVADQLILQEGDESGGGDVVGGGDVGTTGDIVVDQKNHQVFLTEQGQEKAEGLLVAARFLPEGSNLYNPSFISLMHYLNAALRAKHLFHRDQQYVVQSGQVVIVDEFTGRLMPGRRWSDSLHQAIEAKEGVQIQSENQTMASITFQNYFRLYDKLAGMTGTADTEAYEFHQIYGLETVVIPTHKPVNRDDRMDQIYMTMEEKYQAILADIRDCHERGQPVLVGTTSIENSEYLSMMLKKDGLPHQVLNAKQHESEAEIIEQAGRPGVITIATNMAGRGTDIVLGGNINHKLDLISSDSYGDNKNKQREFEKLRSEWQVLHDKVIEAGGLHIIGTERHESRRIDNQLRGRSGRQGDPGSSRFYLSLDDPLLRIFSGDRVRAIMQRLNIPKGEAIEHSMVSRSLESAQRKVEARNFDIRKQLLEYDDVANEQRRIVYQQRNEILEKGASEVIRNMIDGYVVDNFNVFVPLESTEQYWDWDGLDRFLSELSWTGSSREIFSGNSKWTSKDFLSYITEEIGKLYAKRFDDVPEDVRADIERSVLLQSLDTNWKDLLSALDHLRQGIHLRGYAAKNPRQEYKREAFVLFDQMLQNVRRDVVNLLMKVSIVSCEQPLQNDHQFPVEKFSRNQLCPCGSGRKYKHCHGAPAVVTQE
ncbi:MULTISPECIES: preprotein translocase subunit SecA [Candidatus Ichthyocystis]|uniref:Protein translocase subunit SecA n=1 Tax=Candidatus Ichthyocystis hellenicum TaxID=1561003 RepID=A0A0S4M0K9_9BURK|nr:MULTISPECIES: preprotein translocase subunit SecA [Ichthyocystis]CUT17137.1 preprotein translocase subunit SecA [Candidatus Ichthyocystis hellenicum]